MALPQYYHVAAICDPNAERAAALAAECDGAEVVTDFDALCALPHLDVVDICTPSYLHFEQTRQALVAGKHVIVEKPVTSSLRDVDMLIALQAEMGRWVAPIFQNRFGRGVQKLRQLIVAGVTGPAYVTTVEVAWRRGSDYYADPWRGVWATELGGTLATHAIHHLDVLSYLLGSVASVFAWTATRVNPVETEDCAVVSLAMRDGSLVSLISTTGSAVEITRFRFCFRNLVAESNLQPYAAGSEPWSFVGATTQDTARIAEALADWQPLSEGFERQFDDLYTALEVGASPPVTLQDTRTATELLTAIYESARKDVPISLPILSDSPLYAGWLRGQIYQGQS